ncbi:hypothetical protein BCR33DRAFT_718103 [Rhizoclosmatium globosum]|uniref:Uncharacterized protein n=1 Tax=Rhizoclosmatium globosum TaxID=329046 RepID=A0A1Y2C7L2_9FUNG|nr:hypothetical protein BCR33DRAFT_718092 [Rhizoclosmatium globosum]ORY42884.1 hypothetical protein BCR33DRAFT_718103 [Rhizoclosmatium globosum]|eukprot:ORY42873.1 hypothetical protein BCR33DRAFT_718092 [Rhizoclosmatium globosum]
MKLGAPKAQARAIFLSNRFWMSLPTVLATIPCAGLLWQQMNLKQLITSEHT